MTATVNEQSADFDLRLPLIKMLCTLCETSLESVAICYEFKMTTDAAFCYDIKFLKPPFMSTVGVLYSKAIFCNGVSF